MSELLCAKIPDSLSFEEAATIPVVYTTAIASLMDLARLSKDQVCHMLVAQVSLLLRTYLVCAYSLCLRWRWHSGHSNCQNDRSRSICYYPNLLNDY